MAFRYERQMAREERRMRSPKRRRVAEEVRSDRDLRALDRDRQRQQQRENKRNG